MINRVSDLPVVIGVGQLRANRERTVAGAREPAELAHEALLTAAADALPGAAAHPAVARLLADADSIDAVKIVSWAYDDLPGRLAHRIGATPRRTFTSPIGGHWPAQLLDEAAARIAAGQTRIALIVGAEAQASMSALRKAGVDPSELGWSAEPGGPPVFDHDELGSPAMVAAGTFLPTRIYPLFENGLRARLGQSIAEASAWSGELYSAFSRAAAGNPAAWEPVVRTPEEITTVGPDNRMVCEPYPLRQNAMPHVDQAAALIVTSATTAAAYGVDPARMVHVRGGAGAFDSRDILRRPGFDRSDALASALDRCLAAAGVGAEELDLLDVYSCFPVVPKLLATHLGLPRSRPLSVTGGHSSFGGPLNSYSLHSVVALADRLRAGAGLALVHANGGFLTYQHVVLLSRSPGPYVGDPTPVSSAGPAPDVVPPVDGPVVLETATVEFGKAGRPETGFLIGRTPTGTRVAAQTSDADVLSLRHGEVVGRSVSVTVGTDGTVGVH